MSQYLNDASVVIFDKEVKHSYQAYSATLAGTTSERKGVEASEWKFSKMGKGAATRRTAPSADAQAMNVTHGKVTCTLEDWDANEYTDLFASAATNIDEIKELSKTIAGALGRRDDQLKIDAMIAGTYNATPVEDEKGGLVGTAIGGADTDLNIAKLTLAVQYMDDNEVPTEGRHFLMSPSGKKSLLETTEIASVDYNTVKALVRGEVDTFMGFKFHMIGKRTKEGGLAIASSVRDSFAYHESAIGYANGIDMTTSVDWVPVKKSYLSAGNLKAGAVIRDINGIVKIQTTEA